MWIRSCASPGEEILFQRIGIGNGWIGRFLKAPNLIEGIPGNADRLFGSGRSAASIRQGGMVIAPGHDSFGNLQPALNACRLLRSPAKVNEEGGKDGEQERPRGKE